MIAAFDAGLVDLVTVGPRALLLSATDRATDLIGRALLTAFATGAVESARSGLCCRSRVSTPSLAFSSRIVEAHEPMRVQTFRSEFAVERLDEGAQVSFGRVWPIAGPRAALPGPWMDFVHDQLATSGPRKLNRGSIAGEKRSTSPVSRHVECLLAKSPEHDPPVAAFRTGFIAFGGSRPAASSCRATGQPRSSSVCRSLPRADAVASSLTA